MVVTNGRRLISALAASVAAMLLLPGFSAVQALPNSIVMRSGGTLALPAGALFEAEVADGNAVQASDMEDGGICLSAAGSGDSTLVYSLMGMWPVKTVSVSVEPERLLIPGGQSVGIAIDTEGVIVVGASDLGSAPSPARLAGIRSGDIIRKVNGRAVLSAEALSASVDGGDAVTIELLRDGKLVSCEVQPAMDARDGHWRLGAWVRDSTAGVGTLTFIEPDSGLFGALGHAITDLDTSVTLPVGEGELYGNRVVDVTPSKKGKPGELTGDFVFHAVPIGTVETNSGRGIFGHLTSEKCTGLSSEGIPAAGKGEVHAGAASIITTVDGQGPKSYSCEIVRLSPSSEDRRSMVIRITDRSLLEKTGGIVQGMSGSPIIQDGKLIGAVTHVMINDPAMGYGIGIEEMLEAADKLDNGQAQAA